MPKGIKLIFLLLLDGALCPDHVAAQMVDSAAWRQYDYVRLSDMRLTGYNASGLRYLPIDKISEASVSVNKSNGQFVNYYQSDNSRSYEAKTESFYRLSPTVVLSGGISYQHFSGKNMGGSAFINPYYNPFDIVEYADTTRGTKVLETYNLHGAVSADLSERLTLGGRMLYTAANYAKLKDLRHKNSLLDMTITTGLAYRIGKSVEVGANYYYRRSVEGVQFATYGTSDKQYTSLISYGASFGKSEVFGDTGYTSKNDNKPMYNTFHGLSLQLGVDLNPRINMFNEITYKIRNGEFGERSYNSIVYSEHSSTIVEYNGSLSVKRGKTHHLLNLHVENETLENLENVYRFETKPGGTSYIVYFDPLEVGDRTMTGARAEYVANMGVANYAPKWTLGAGVDFRQISQTASFYPYFRKQTIRYTNFCGKAARNIIDGKNMYSFSVDMQYSSGGGTMNNDGTYTTPGENQTKPKYNDRNLKNEFEYLTSQQFRGDVGLKISRLIGRDAARGYAALNYCLTKALNTEHLDGDNHNAITLTIGCSF